MKFTLLTTFSKDDQDRIQNKKVCDVVEFVVASEIGYYKGWLGSVEDAYFSVAFVKGVLSISLEEREMLVGKKITNVAMASHLYDLITSKKMDINAIQQLVVDYNIKSSNDDVQKVKFSDVMKTLKWKFKSRKVKVDEHFLN